MRQREKQARIRGAQNKQVQVKNAANCKITSTHMYVRACVCIMLCNAKTMDIIKCINIMLISLCALQRVLNVGKMQ